MTSVARVLLQDVEADPPQVRRRGPREPAGRGRDLVEIMRAQHTVDPCSECVHLYDDVLERDAVRHLPAPVGFAAGVAPRRLDLLAEEPPHEPALLNVKEVEEELER